MEDTGWGPDRRALHIEPSGPSLLSLNASAVVVDGDASGKRAEHVFELHKPHVEQAIWVLEVDRIGPFLVEGDAEGRSLFALANREIDARIAEVYRGLPKLALSRFGEVLSRTDEVV